MRPRRVLALLAFVFALALGALPASVHATAGGMNIFCPFLATRSPLVINATGEFSGTYPCGPLAILNVTGPTGLQVQYPILSCANGVHQFNVTFTDSGVYRFKLFFGPGGTSPDSNCTTTYYAPVKRTVPDTPPAVAILAALVAGLFVAGAVGKKQKRKFKNE